MAYLETCPMCGSAAQRRIVPVWGCVVYLTGCRNTACPVKPESTGATPEKADGEWNRKARRLAAELLVPEMEGAC